MKHTVLKFVAVATLCSPMLSYGAQSEGLLGEILHGPDNPPAISAPEIDPASAMGALTLLAGSLAVMRGRRRKQ